MLGKVFKAYDVRGTYPDPLDEKMAWQIGYGISKFLIHDAAAVGENTPMMRNIVVGRDMRKSCPGLTKALIQGINDHGGNVIDVGLVDTSFIYFAVNHLDCAGGVMTTASHNPPNYNGFKVSKRKAKPVGEATGLAEVRKHAAMVDKATVVSAKGRAEQRNLWEPYAKHVRSFLDLKPGAKTVRIVIDASNGMAGTMIPQVFGKKAPPSLGPAQGIEIIELNFENSKGEFVHEPNPLVAANLAQLQQRVVAEKADLGVCFDGDADRCVIVDETGTIVGCDHLTALLAPYFLKKGTRTAGASNAIAYDLRSTKAVPEEIIKAGGTPLRSRVGHVFMKSALGEHHCPFGGELSGHFYFRDNFNADSGAIALCVVLTVLRQYGKKMSQLIAPLKRYAQSGELNFQIEDKDAALSKVKDEFGTPRAGAKVDELDGVTIDLFEKHGSGSAGGWWANIRKSNTEPLLRLNLEARDKKTLDIVLARLSPMLGVRVAH